LPGRRTRFGQLASHRPPVGVRRPCSVSGDEDDVTRTKLRDALGAVQLDLSLQDHDRLRITRVDVRRHAVVGLGRHLTEAPPVTSFGDGDDVASERVGARSQDAIVGSVIRIPSSSRTNIAPDQAGLIARSPARSQQAAW
jgi:hypothetical protein